MCTAFRRALIHPYPFGRSYDTMIVTREWFDPTCKVSSHIYIISSQYLSNEASHRNLNDILMLNIINRSQVFRRT